MSCFAWPREVWSKDRSDWPGIVKKTSGNLPPPPAISGASPFSDEPSGCFSKWVSDSFFWISAYSTKRNLTTSAHTDFDFPTPTPIWSTYTCTLWVRLRSFGPNCQVPSAAEGPQGLAPWRRVLRWLNPCFCAGKYLLGCAYLGDRQKGCCSFRFPRDQPPPKGILTKSQTMCKWLIQ